MLVVKKKNKHADRKIKETQGRSTLRKQPVIAIIKKGEEKEVRAFHVEKNNKSKFEVKFGKRITYKELISK